MNDLQRAIQQQATKLLELRLIPQDQYHRASLFEKIQALNEESRMMRVWLEENGDELKACDHRLFLQLQAQAELCGSQGT